MILGILVLLMYVLLVGTSLYFIGSAIHLMFDGIGDWGFDLMVGVVMSFMTVGFTVLAHDRYKQEQAHPCIEWKQTYDTGGLDPVCVKRKP